MSRRIAAVVLCTAAVASDPVRAAPEGTVTARTPHSYQTLIERLDTGRC